VAVAEALRVGRLAKGEEEEELQERVSLLAQSSGGHSVFGSSTALCRAFDARRCTPVACTGLEDKTQATVHAWRTAVYQPVPHSKATHSQISTTQREDTA